MKSNPVIDDNHCGDCLQPLNYEGEANLLRAKCCGRTYTKTTVTMSYAAKAHAKRYGLPGDKSGGVIHQSVGGRYAIDSAYNGGWYDNENTRDS